MVVLIGCNLNKRHHELNTKVNEAAKNNANFEEIKNKNETSDVDKLFKIDLAAKYKNITYILDVLKSGDSLYISRALSCDWVADDEFAQFMNPQYLTQDVFPFMSPKMKKKLLATLSVRVRNAERAEEFYHYCMRDRMYNHGMNFLLYTKEVFKIDILTLHPHVYNDFHRNEKYLEHFIGNSFILAELYLKAISEMSRSGALNKLRYLYSASADQYLNLLEKFHPRYGYSICSKRLSQAIMKKHKQRVVRDPCLYLNMIRHEIVTEYSNTEDAKIYAVAFMPEHEYQFWQGRYYNSNKYYLSLIPLGERFGFIKKIFTDKYPEHMFEDNFSFYLHYYYEMMTQQEKEDWALRQVASGKELHGCDNDYIWYRFINFPVAFVELKKYILIAPSNDKRSKIIETLVESVKSQEELTTLLEYYYSRHINELKKYKKSFMDLVMKHHDVLNFNDECWTVFEKILYSLEVYHTFDEDNIDYENTEYRVISLKYYIIHEKLIPEMFYDYVISHIITFSRMRYGFDADVDTKKLDMIFQYMLSCFTRHVERLMKVKNEKNTDELDRYINDILDLAVAFHKTLEEISKLIEDYVMSKFDVFKHHQIFIHLKMPPIPEFRISDIMHYLKQDASLVVSHFHKIREYFQVNNPKYLKRNINWLIRKLQIYFCHDIAPEYIKLLNECLTIEELHFQTARVAVFGIFNLSDEEYKINFLKKYVPADTKVDHGIISRNLLTIQTAICSVACHSRPPLPLSSFRDYIKGDYLQYCVPTFNAYVEKLTPDQCLSFVESLLNSPVSVQKHALRLAFHCFSTENLKNLVLKVWKKTQNVSIRKVLYTALFDKVNYYHDNLQAQLELFEALTFMTSTLHQNDDDELFHLLVSLLPSPVLGKHLECAYNVVKDFPKRLINFQRFARIINTIENHVLSVSPEFVRGIMKEHVEAMLDQNLMLGQELKDGHIEVITAKWALIKTGIVKHKDVYIIDMIMDNFLSRWRKTFEDEYVYRRFLIEFLNDLEERSYNENVENYLEINSIFQLILKKIENAIPCIEIYLTVWKLKTSIIARQVLGKRKPQPYDNAKDTILKYSSRIRDLIKEYIEKEMFFKTFYAEIKHVINDGLWKIGRPFVYFYDERENACVLLCSTISEYDNREMQLFVMDFIANDYKGPYLNVYRGIIDKLKSVDDEEVKYFMCHKFYGSDYHYRDFMPYNK